MACGASAVSTEFELPWLARLRKFEAGAGRQRRVAAISARCLRRSSRLDVSRASRRDQNRPKPIGDCMAALMKFLETKWEKPDEGIWEVRGGRAAFHPLENDGVAGVRSRGQADRELQLRSGENLERWRKIRDEIHAQVCERGYNEKKKAFTQVYGSDELDASLLMMPLVGFLPTMSDQRAVAARSKRSSASWCRMVLSCVIARRKQMSMDCPAAKASFFCVRSGWPIACTLMGRTDEARRFSSACSICATMSACFRRNTIRARNAARQFSRRPLHVALVNTAPSCQAALLVAMEQRRRRGHKRRAAPGRSGRLDSA